MMLIAYRRGSMLTACLCMGVMLSGCGGVSMPIGSSDPATPLDLTGSIDAQRDTADLDINQQDRAIIAKAIATARETGSANPPFTWTNPLTGNSGTILTLTDETIASGTGCARFETTANTIGGVRSYEGVACRDVMQTWQVIQLHEDPINTPDDATPRHVADLPQG